MKVSWEDGGTLDADARERIDLAIRKHAKLCSFCGKSLREVKRMVEAETGARLCNECHAQCVPLFGGAR